MALEIRFPAMTYVFLCSLWIVGALALDPRGLNTTNSTNACSNYPGNTSPVLHVNYQSQQAIFWTSTAIAVLVSFVQGAITTLIDVCEAESLWTVRFRLALFEHHWWIGIAVALLMSFAIMVVSFLAGKYVSSGHKHDASFPQPYARTYQGIITKRWVSWPWQQPLLLSFSDTPGLPGVIATSSKIDGQHGLVLVGLGSPQVSSITSEILRDGAYSVTAQTFLGTTLSTRPLASS